MRTVGSLLCMYVLHPVMGEQSLRFNVCLLTLGLHFDYISAGMLDRIGPSISLVSFGQQIHFLLLKAVMFSFSGLLAGLTEYKYSGLHYPVNDIQM